MELSRAALYAAFILLKVSAELALPLFRSGWCLLAATRESASQWGNKRYKSMGKTSKFTKNTVFRLYFLGTCSSRQSKLSKWICHADVVLQYTGTGTGTILT